MAASKETVRQVINVILKHIKDDELVARILADLVKIDGNSSFKATMQRLVEEMKSK
jgi:hypothetical protein